MPRVILIVEDTAALAASLALALTTMDGIKSVVFGSAGEALRYMREEAPELAALISDLNLPDEDGFSLIRRIRGMPGQSDLPAILITAEENPRCPQGRDAGEPNAIFKKPFSMKEVRRVLETLL